MGTDERELEEVLRLKRRRLAELQKDLARLGYDAPPALRTEEEDLRHELEKERRILEPVINGELSDEALAALRAYGLPASISRAIMMVEQAIGDLRRMVQAQQSELHAVKDKVLPMAADIQALKRDNEEGKHGRRRNFWLLVTSIVVSLLPAVIFIIWLAVR